MSAGPAGSGRHWSGRCIVAGVVASALAASLAGCGKSTSGAPSAAASASTGAASARAAAPISVTLVKAQARDVDVLLEATGTVSALNTVDIRSQVASVITKVHIREGQYVKAGDLLFTLDARNDEVAIAKANAQLARDNAALADAQRQLARSRELVAQNFISQSALDTNRTAVAAQQALVDADRAAVEAARVGLSYTRLVAPAAGRAGAINVYAGSTVQPGGSALVTITQLDPIAVSFSLPQRNLGDALALLRSGGGKVVAEMPEKRGALVGRLGFVDNGVDPNSGTVKAKAQFDNAREQLWPGAFVNIRLAARTLKDAVVVPQAAVIQSPRGDIVYTLDAQKRAVARPVEIVHSAGLDAVVTGIAAGESVVLDGRQNLRPGSVVVERPAAAASGRAGGSIAAPGNGSPTAASGIAVAP